MRFRFGALQVKTKKATKTTITKNEISQTAEQQRRHTRVPHPSPDWSTGLPEDIPNNDDRIRKRATTDDDGKSTTTDDARRGPSHVLAAWCAFILVGAVVWVNQVRMSECGDGSVHGDGRNHARNKRIHTNTWACCVFLDSLLAAIASKLCLV